MKVVKLSKKKAQKPDAREVATLIVRDHPEETDELVRAKKVLDSAERVFQSARDVVEPIAMQARELAEEGGDFTARVAMQGTDQRAIFQVTNTFTKMDPSSALDVEQALGKGTFGQLFERHEVVQVRKGAIERLRDAVIEAGHDPDEFFETKKFVKPIKTFRRDRHELRSTLPAEINTAIDEVIEQIEGIPTLTFK